jgi:hypothetical protein
VDHAVDEQGGGAEHLARSQAAVHVPADPVGHRAAGAVLVEDRRVQAERVVAGQREFDLDAIQDAMRQLRKCIVIFVISLRQLIAGR